MVRHEQKALILLLVLLCTLVGGCMEKETADVSIRTFCEALLHRDPAQLKKINRTADETERAFLCGFVPAYQQASGNIFTDEQARRIGIAFLHDLRKIEIIGTEVTAKNAKKATVKVTVGKLNIASLENNLQAEVQRQVSIGTHQNRLWRLQRKS